MLIPAVRLVGIGEGRMVEVDFEVLNSIGGVAVFDLQGKTQYTNYPMLVRGGGSGVG